MLYLNAKEIREIFSMREAIESDREAFMIQAEGLAEVPVRTNFDVVNDGITSFMPALIKKYPRAGIKIVSTYTENYTRGMSAVSATVLLADPELQAIQAYDVWKEKKLYGKVSMGVVRTTYIIGADGKIEAVMPKVKPDTNAQEILDRLG